MNRIDLAGLTTHVVGPADAPTTVVLLHGFGANADDLVGLAGVLGDQARYVVPDAPLELGGLYGPARAWWMLDLERLERDLGRGVPTDLRDELPDGLVRAREQVMRLLDQVEARLVAPGGRLVLGGFSQGAMLSLDVALHRATRPAGLLLMSGTLIAQSVWQPRFESLRGLPVLMSHGRHDALLSFAVAETLRDRLIAAGADVAWYPFLGGHEIPATVIAAARAFVTG